MEAMRVKRTRRDSALLYKQTKLLTIRISKQTSILGTFCQLGCCNAIPTVTLCIIFQAFVVPEIAKIEIMADFREPSTMKQKTERFSAERRNSSDVRTYGIILCYHRSSGPGTHVRFFLNMIMFIYALSLLVLIGSITAHKRERENFPSWLDNANVCTTLKKLSPKPNKKEKRVKGFETQIAHSPGLCFAPDVRSAFIEVGGDTLYMVRNLRIFRSFLKVY
uniref:Uncharacterized protein n=1 Tax=Glossina palpalis gambiensis TaxID=67801 RepID=A0A1B0AU09_9MUSC